MFVQLMARFPYLLWAHIHHVFLAILFLTYSFGSGLNRMMYAFSLLSQLRSG